METLKNKIDFAVIFSVNGANPNGDPLNGNRPRMNYDGFGEVSDVCIKRKIRNRLMENGHNIFVQSDDNKIDSYKNLRERQEKELKSKSDDQEKFKEEACKKWIDIRSFGQVFAFKGKKGKKNKSGQEDNSSSSDTGVSIGIRGPVSIHPAFSISSVSGEINSQQIVKSTSNEGDGIKRQSDQMGMKHRVDHGVYKFYGAINPQLASKTWFYDDDAKVIKNSLEHLFDNDASSARPEGSMEVVAVFWWQHNVKHGQYSSAVVHRALSVEPKKGVSDPKKIENYSIKLKSLSGLEPEIFNPNNVTIERT